MLQKTKMTFLRLFAIIGFVVLFAIASISLASCSSETVTVTGMSVNSSGELVVTYSDGSTQNLGSVTGATGSQGTQGETGETGVGIEKVELSSDGTSLIIYYTDDTTGSVDISSLTTSTADCDHLTSEGKDAYAIWAEATEEGDGIIYQAKTCDEDTVYLYYCTECGNIKVVYVTKEHEWEKKTVAATCETDGYTYYECKNCGESKLDDNKEIVKEDVVAAYGHSHADNTYVQYLWDDETVGCEKGGVMFYQCDNCGQAITEIIEAGSHTIAVASDLSNVTDPEIDTYTTGWGTTATDYYKGAVTGTCSVCGLTNVEVVIPAFDDEDAYTITEGSWVSGDDDGEDTRTDTYTYVYDDGTTDGVTLTFKVEKTSAHQISGNDVSYATTANDAKALDVWFGYTSSYEDITYQDLIDDGLLKLSANQTATCAVSEGAQTAYKYEYTCEVCGKTHYLYLTTPHTYAYAVKTTSGSIVEANGAYTYAHGTSDTYDMSGTSYQYVKYCSVCNSVEAVTDTIASSSVSTSTTVYKAATCVEDGAAYKLVTFADKTTEVLNLVEGKNTAVISATGHLINGIRIPTGASIHVTTGTDGNTLVYYTTGATTSADKTIITIIYGTYTGSDYSVNGSKTVAQNGVEISITAGSTPCASTASGVATFFCEDATCQANKTDTATYTSVTDHSFSDYTTNLGLDVTSEGKTTTCVYVNGTAYTYAEAASAGYITAITNSSNEVTGYNYTVASVCVTAGYKLVKCSVCGEIHVEALSAASEHTYKYTLSEDHKTINVTCSVSGCTYEGTTLTVASVATVTSKVTTAATCTSTGVTTYTVSFKGIDSKTTAQTLTYTEEIAVTGHYLNGVEIDASLTYYIGENDNGWYAYYMTGEKTDYVYGAADDADSTTLAASILVYENNGKYYVNNKGTITEVSNYRYYIINESSTSSATCSKAGTGVFYCTDSGHSTKVSVDVAVKAGHVWVEDETYSYAATSYEEGRTYYNCSECSDATTYDVIAPLGFDTANATVKASGTTAADAEVTIVVNGKGTANTDVLTIVITKSAITATLTRGGTEVAVANVAVTSTGYCAYTYKDATCASADQNIYAYDYTITITGDSTAKYVTGPISSTKIVEGKVDASGHTWKGVESSYYRTASSDGMTYLYVVDYCTTCEKYNIKDKTLVTITEGTNGALEATIGASSSYPSYYIVKLDITEAGFYSVTLDGEGKENVYVKISGYNDSYNYYYADLNYETSGWGPYAAVTQTGEYTSYIFDYNTDYPAEFTKDGASLYVYIYTFDETVEASEFSVTLTKLTDFDLDAYIDAQIAAQYDYVLTTSGLVADLASDGTWTGAEYTFYVNEAGTYTIAVSGDSSSEIDYDDGYNAESLWAGYSTTYTFAVGDTFSLWCPYDATVTITAAGGTTPSTPTAQPVSYSIVFDDYGYTSKQTFEEAGTYYLTTTGYNTTGSSDDVVIYYTTTKTDSDSINYSSSDYLTVGNDSYYSCLQFNGGSGTSDRVLTIDLSDYAGYSVTITLQMTAAKTNTVATLSDSSNSLATSGDTTGEGITKYSSIPLTYTGTVTSDGIYTLLASQSLRVYSISIELTPAA